MVFAVKDNIDVAGLPTTAAAPSYAYVPRSDATAVARLRAAGAVVIGKTNLDQFATGWWAPGAPTAPSATRGIRRGSPVGRPLGSAVAVALGIVDFALGTDTAGSGRVPAALNGIVGVKPTRGLVPVTGVVPACYTLDCVTVFARDLTLARIVTELMEGPDGSPLCRSGSQADPAPARPRLAVPPQSISTAWPTVGGRRSRPRWPASRRLGAEIVEIDIGALLEAAALLYDGAFVAERYAAVGAHLEKHADLIGTGLDPVVAGDHPGRQGENSRRLGVGHRRARRARRRRPRAL